MAVGNEDRLVRHFADNGLDIVLVAQGPDAVDHAVAAFHFHLGLARCTLARTPATFALGVREEREYLAEARLTCAQQIQPVRLGARERCLVGLDDA